MTCEPDDNENFTDDIDEYIQSLTAAHLAFDGSIGVMITLEINPAALKVIIDALKMYQAANPKV